MAEENRSGGGSTLLALILGATAGVIAGILFAPRSGKETREQFQNWMEDLEGKGEELLEEGRGLWAQGKQAAQSKAEKLKQTMESAPRKAWGDDHGNSGS